MSGSRRKALWRALPTPLQDAVSLAVARAQGERIPPPPSPARRRVRLMIAPANFAGQGYRWARAVERNPDVAAMNMVLESINTFRYPADNPVPGRIGAHSRTWQRRQLRALTSEFTHMLVESEMRPLGSAYGKDIRAQLRAIQAGGVRLGMICHGTDVRLPSRHAAQEPMSPFVDDSWVPVAELEKVVLANHELLAELGVPVFVTTPGLLLDLPDAHLLPVVIDDERWAGEVTRLERERLVVAHVPSNPVVKGTAAIEEVMRRLDAEGIVEYRAITGVSHDEMPRVIREADVVLDQFRLGDYGVAACESMAAGRLVVSHVDPGARQVVRELSGLPLPVVEATVDTLESVLRSIVERRGEYREMAAAGPEFVARTHEGTLSRDVLERHFLFAPHHQSGSERRG